MAEYYFLVSFLPQLEIGHLPTLSFTELKDLLETHLTPADLATTRRLRRLIDIENIRALLAHEPCNPRGNLTQEELEKALNDLAWSDEEPFPAYLVDFLERYATRESRLAHFAELLSRFLQEESRRAEGFLHDYFAFERELNLVFVGFRAKRLDRDVIKELTYEDPREPLIAEIIAQKDAATYEPPFEFRALKPLFEAYGTLALELYQALVLFRFNEAQTLVEGERFSIDRILSYMVRLMMVERWLELNHEKGMRVVHTIEEGIR